nr:forespore capture DNA-binding protein RefZ [Brevibacillus sp. SYP-B805]
MEAAAKLFDAQGYNGTTVRQIAEEAKVNVALISYYFQGKQGVLEVLISHYFETFFRLLADDALKERQLCAFDKLLAVVRLYVFFQRDHAAISRLIQRELSVESMLAREVMTLYINRWKHEFAIILEEGMNAGEFAKIPVEHVLLAMSSMLIYPYLNPQFVREVFYLEPASDEFCEWLVASVSELLRSLLLSSHTRK